MKNTIANADCYQAMLDMHSNSFDHALTSPPYNRLRNDVYEYYDDRKRKYDMWLGDVIEQLIRVTEGHVFFNIQQNYYNRADLLKTMGMFADDIVDMFAWEKSNPKPSAGTSITNAWEFIIVFGSEPLISDTTYTKNIITTSVWSARQEGHKAVMHPNVAKFFIRHFTKKGDLVFDPFMGTGTTAKACIALDRDYFGCEIIEEYCDISNNHSPEQMELI